MTIKIKDRDCKIKQTIRAIFLWEQISEKRFELKSTLDNYLYFYCILLANNPDFMSWDEYLDEIDDNPEMLVQMSNILAGENELEKLLNPEVSSGDSDKKKV